MVIRQATFNPKTLTVKKGTQVEFGNLDHYNYIIISEGLFNTILLSEDSFFYYFYNAGTYNVWIDSTQGVKLEGTVVVTE
jgi:plastocyanin